MTNFEGGVSDEPLPEAEVLEGWVPLEAMTQV